MANSGFYAQDGTDTTNDSTKRFTSEAPITSFVWKKDPTGFGQDSITFNGGVRHFGDLHNAIVNYVDYIQRNPSVRVAANMGNEEFGRRILDALSQQDYDGIANLANSQRATGLYRTLLNAGKDMKILAKPGRGWNKPGRDYYLQNVNDLDPSTNYYRSGYGFPGEAVSKQRHGGRLLKKIFI